MKMVKTRLLMIFVVIIMLLLMTVPVSAVKPPVDSQGNIWTALETVQNQITAIQNQITALTQRVDALENSPMPEYRAGTYTTPPKPLEEPYFSGYETQTVTFSHPMPNTNYRVSITSTNKAGIYEPYTGQCVNQMCFFTIDSKTTTGFTFSTRLTVFGTIAPIASDRTFDYIAIADN
jgi:hypothetical protein